jgi:hypothetical protein
VCDRVICYSESLKVWLLLSGWEVKVKLCAAYFLYIVHVSFSYMQFNVDMKVQLYTYVCAQK